MNSGVHGDEALSSFSSDIFVGEANVAKKGVSDKTETLNKGDQGDGVGSGVNSANQGKVIDLFLGGTTELDLLLFHAAVHVEGLAFETTSHLHTNQVLNAVEGDHAQVGAKKIFGLVVGIKRVFQARFPERTRGRRDKLISRIFAIRRLLCFDLNGQ